MGQQQCCNTNSIVKNEQISFFYVLFYEIEKFDENRDPRQAQYSKPILKIQGLNQQQKQNNCGSFQDNQPEIEQTVRNVLEEVMINNKKNKKCYMEEIGLDDPKYFHFRRTGIIYKGQWKKKHPHGNGINYYPNGGVYIGSFYEGIAHGYGTFIMKNGDYYQGEVKFGRANGEGIYHSEESVYRGQFKDNMKHGVGQQSSQTYFFKGIYDYGEKKSGTLKFEGNIYEGGFLDDKYQGSGKLTTLQGYYIGQFKDGLQNGYGQFRWNDKSVYRGKYENGMRQGSGEFYDSKNCSISRGQWKNGYLQGSGEYVEPRGAINKCIWEKGKIVGILQSK